MKRIILSIKGEDSWCYTSRVA